MFGEKFPELHDDGFRFENRPFKLFVISDIFGKFILKQNLLHFEQNGYFDFACFEEDMIIQISKFLTQNTLIHIGKTIIEHNGFDILQNDFLLKEQMTFKSISPVTCYIMDEKTIYFEPDSNEFKNQIINNIVKKHELIYQTNCPDFGIEAIEKIRKRVVHYKNNFVVSFDIKITFNNLNKNILQIILNTGIGSKNSMGFGMLRYEN